MFWDEIDPNKTVTASYNNGQQASSNMGVQKYQRDHWFVKHNNCHENSIHHINFAITIR
jgi:hypothetical protein